MELEKLEKESLVLTKSLNIIDNPEIILKLNNKINAAPDKMKRMQYKWIKYENEQKSILSELKEEIKKKRVSKFNEIVNDCTIVLYFTLLDFYTFCIKCVLNTYKYVKYIFDSISEKLTNNK